MSPLNEVRLVDLPKISDPRGNLTSIEGRAHVPFDIACVHYLCDVPGGEPRVSGDARGFFCETYQAERNRATSIDAAFAQDNASRLARSTLRGLHFQMPPHDQAKLVSCFEGAAFDIVGDLRVGSPTHGEWHGPEISADNMRQMFVPQGSAHGFVVTSETALFSCECSDLSAPQAEGATAWDDPDLTIDWPAEAPTLSGEDAAAPTFAPLDSPFAYAAPHE